MPSDVRGGAFCDYDNDGDLDVCITSINDRCVFLRNDGANTAGHRLETKSVGTRSNRDGIGALVKIVAGELTQYDRVRAGGNFLSGNDLRLYFGLAGQQEAEVLEVHLPSVTVDRLSHIDANQILVIQEGKGRTSSPYRSIKSRRVSASRGRPIP